MDKYNAWISNIEPLTIGNEKSITQIMSELIPLLLNVKSFQDEQNTLLNENFKSLNNSSNNFKESITTNTQMFDTLRGTITLNIKNIEDGYTAKISEEFSKMLNKLNNIPITQNEFDEGVYSVNYDLNNPNSAYSRWKRDIYTIIFSNIVGWDENPHNYGLWYNSTDKQVYVEDEIWDYTIFGHYYKYQDKLLYRDVDLELGEELFPHNENAYFIGFIDNNTACYFETSTSATETKYTIKTINLTTKEITAYENLVLPDNFKELYLQDNSHYIIGKYNEYYYVIYTQQNNTLPAIMKSNDLVHWDNVSNIRATGECAIKVIKNNLYFVSINSGTWLLNNDMSFTEIKVNNEKVFAMGEFKDNFIFIDSSHHIYKSTLNDFSQKTYCGICFYFYNLSFGLSDDNGCVGGISSWYSSNGDNIYTLSLNYLGMRINRLNILTEVLLAFRGGHDYADERVVMPLHKYQYGNFVITNDGKIYSDFNLQRVTAKTEVIGINT